MQRSVVLLQECADLVADLVGALEIGKMAAVAQQDQASMGHRLRDMGGACQWDEITIAVQNQRGDAQTSQPWQQVVVADQPGLTHQAILDSASLENALPGETRSQAGDYLLKLLW